MLVLLFMYESASSSFEKWDQMGRVRWPRGI